VLLGRGDSTFEAAVTVQTDTSRSSVAVGDFDADGKLDLATGGSDSISVLLGKGDGSFSPPTSYSAGSTPRCFVTVGDFNRDGKPDLAVANYRSGEVSILLGNGDGTFQPAVDFAVGVPPYAMAAADLNIDNGLDLVVAVNVNSSLARSAGYVATLLNACAAPPPNLSIVRNNTIAIISWPFPSAGFVLESTPSLSQPNWQPTVEASLTNNGHRVVAAPIDQAESYFRLHKP
jgi:hypothetical protein